MTVDEAAVRSEVRVSTTCLLPMFPRQGRGPLPRTEHFKLPFGRHCGEVVRDLQGPPHVCDWSEVQEDLDEAVAVGVVHDFE